MPKLKDSSRIKRLTISARIEKDLKERAEAVFVKNSLSVSDVIRMVFQKAALKEDVSFIFEGEHINSPRNK